MTIDKLAVMMNNNFDRLEGKLDKVEGKLDKKIDTKVEELKSQIEGIDKRIDDFVVTRVKYDDFNKLTVRVEKLEKAK